MKFFNLPAWLLGIAVVLFGMGLAAEAEEIIVLALAAGAASVFTYVVTLRSRLAVRDGSASVEARLEALEKRLGLTEGELDVANEQLQRLRAEREFDRALESGRGAAGSQALIGPP